MFIVLEIQTHADGTVGTLVDSYADRNDAENKYHTILAYASKSNLPMHSAVMVTNDGVLIRSESYNHPQEDETTEEA